MPLHSLIYDVALGLGRSAEFQNRNHGVPRITLVADQNSISTMSGNEVILPTLPETFLSGGRANILHSIIEGQEINALAFERSARTAKYCEGPRGDVGSLRQAEGSLPRPRSDF